MDVTDLKDTLTFTQQTRLDLVTSLLADDRSKTDRNTIRVVNEVLNSMDSAVLSKQKLKIEEGVAESKSAAVKILNEVYQKMGGYTHKAIDVETRQLQVAIDLCDEDLVPGETDIGTIVLADELEPIRLGGGV